MISLRDLTKGESASQVQDFLDTASGQDQASPNLLSLIPDGFLSLVLSCLLQMTLTWVCQACSPEAHAL